MVRVCSRRQSRNRPRILNMITWNQKEGWQVWEQVV